MPPRARPAYTLDVVARSLAQVVTDVAARQAAVAAWSSRRRMLAAPTRRSTPGRLPLLAREEFLNMGEGAFGWEGPVLYACVPQEKFWWWPGERPCHPVGLHLLAVAPAKGALTTTYRTALDKCTIAAWRCDLTSSGAARSTRSGAKVVFVLVWCA